MNRSLNDLVEAVAGDKVHNYSKCLLPLNCSTWLDHTKQTILHRGLSKSQHLFLSSPYAHTALDQELSYLTLLPRLNMHSSLKAGDFLPAVQHF